MRQIGDPDGEEVAVGQVGPEHDESEHEIAQVMQVAADLVAAPPFVGGADRQHAQRSALHQLRGQGFGGEDRGIPAGRKRHDPVYHREAAGQCIQHQAQGAQAARARGREIPARPTHEQAREHEPDDEIHHRAQDEKAGVEIRLLVRQVMGKYTVPGEPRVEGRQAEQHRQEQHALHRQHPGGGDKGRGGRLAPAAAGEVADHVQAQGAQRQAQPEQPGEQIGTQETLRLRQRGEP